MSQTLAERQAYLGSSDAPAVLGRSRWKTQLAIWAEKTGQYVPEDEPTLQKKLGIRLEEVVAELFMEATGKTVRRANDRRVHPKYPFLVAQIDRTVVDEDSILECKTATAWKAKEWEGEEIPQEYIIQCHHQLAVTGKNRCYIAVLIGNQDFKWKVIERDPVLLAEMVKMEVSFWERFVIPKIMPGAISKDDKDTLLGLFPKASPESEIELGDEAAKLIESRAAMYQDCINLEGQIEKIENEIRAKMGANELATAGKWKVSWKNQTTRRCDTTKLKEEAPDVFNKFLAVSETRVLRISEVKAKAK